MSAILGAVAALFELAPHGIVYWGAYQWLHPTPNDWSLAQFMVLATVAPLMRYACLASSLTLWHAVAFDVLKRMRLVMVERISNATPQFLHSQTPGLLKQTLVEDIDAVENSVAHQIPDVFGLCVALFGLCVALFGLCVALFGLCKFCTQLMEFISVRERLLHIAH
ncbi:MAG: ABC-type multidrug transport system fused ATPase/permease subunit [Myxococcota bacterium]|jgi:ABC-type multidrug transport system fused ATPase/permease subunit